MATEVRISQHLNSCLRFLWAVVTLLIGANAYGQDEKRAIEIYPTVGITWRSTAMNFFNFTYLFPDDFSKVYPYEKNVQGLSLNIGCLLQTKIIGFEYYPNLRYDVVHSTVGVENVYVKGFLIDHNFNLIVKRKAVDFGLGMSIVNAGKGYHFNNPGPRYHNIEFKTYNAFVTVPIKKKIHLEIKAQYIPKGFPYNPGEKYITYSLRGYYRFGFLNKPKKKKD